MCRILALDVGDKRIGVALSDPSQTLASPLKTILRSDDAEAVREILDLVEKYAVRKLVVGLPYLLSGAMGKQAEKVLAFVQQVVLLTNIEVVMQDERMTSISANHKLREAGKKGRRLKTEIDAAAATVILQSYLDEVADNINISQPGTLAI